MNDNENNEIIKEIKKELDPSPLSFFEKRQILKSLHNKISPKSEYPHNSISPFFFLKRNVFAGFAFTFLFVFVSGFGVVAASGSSLPGDTLYGVKIGFEEVKSIFVQDEESARFHHERIINRIDEVKQILVEDHDISSEQLDVAENLISKHSKKVRDNIDEIDNFTEKISLSNEVLGDLELYEKISDEIQEKNVFLENLEDDANKVDDEIVEISTDLNEYVTEALEDGDNESITEIVDVLELESVEINTNIDSIVEIISDERKEDVLDEFIEFKEDINIMDLGTASGTDIYLSE